MMDGQMALDIGKPLGEWDGADLLDWLSRLGTFEMRDDDQLRRDDRRRASSSRHAADKGLARAAH